MRLGLALATVRFDAIPRVDFDALRALRRAVTRFLRCTFDRFFSLAMMGPSLGYSSRPGQQLGPASPVLSYDRYDSECRKFAAGKFHDRHSG